ncbi:hypothetical protein DK847_15375 [Aestuariivirga litoralis]|uniref:Uncharacterized protein n=1 Tax=Aestuariivirga litoralis TaxID=2650924 RepID=A0A2W2C761_9HYPH|nr:hypothetical protein [Aestuariivirga litoralis]PZF76023.1 hypothetical protein DK847_15375 [Aestuariivirga litoralis]
MSRADFWCRVIGWLQVAGALAVGTAIYAAWEFIFGWIVMENPGFFTVIKWILIIIFAFPPFLSGLLTVVFADRVEQAREGKRDEQHVFLRVVTALAGLWSAGVVGFVGLHVPPIGFFSVLGLATAVMAVMGADWTADLFATRNGPGRGTA